MTEDLFKRAHLKFVFVIYMAIRELPELLCQFYTLMNVLH